MTYSITAKARPQDISNELMREEMRVPAVLYGTGLENTQLELDERAFKKVYIEAGQAQLVDLQIEGKDSVPVLIREVQTHPVKDRIVHVDFYALDVNKPVEVDVPLHFEGISPAVKASGGSLLKRREYVPVRTLPKDLVKYVTVDLTKLETVEDVIRVSDLDKKESWEILVDVEDVVAQVLPPRVVEEPTTASPAEGEAPAADGEEKKEGEVAPAEGEKKE